VEMMKVLDVVSVLKEKIFLKFLDVTKILETLREREAENV
jgi:hypothetical protein